MRDILEIPLNSGDVELDFCGSTSNEGVSLVQRLYALLLTDGGKAYWNDDDDDGSGLLDLLKGSNRPASSDMQAYVDAALNAAVGMLGEDDMSLISGVEASCDDDLNVTIRLTLNDNTILQGVVNING